MAITVQGNDLQVYLGSNATRAVTTSGADGERNPIAHAQTVTLDFSNSLIDVTTKSSNSWMEKISGQRSFTVSVDGLIDDYATTSTSDRTPLVVAGYAGIGASGATASQIYFEFSVGSSGEARYVGSGYISSFSQTGGTDDAPTYSISIEGTGELTYSADVTP